MNWFHDIAGQSLLPESAHIVRILAAVVLGGLIGLEREVRDKPAGFRTMILICVGACIFTILSQTMGAPERDSTRIAAQIVTGIGFLGAGAILHGKGNIIGLTTAATIWAVAAVGMALGFGHLVLGTFSTIVILIALLVFNLVENWIGEFRDLQEYCIITANTPDALERIDTIFQGAGLDIRRRSCHQEGSSLVVNVVAMGPKAGHHQMHISLARSEEYTLGKV